MSPRTLSGLSASVPTRSGSHTARGCPGYMHTAWLPSRSAIRSSYKRPSLRTDVTKGGTGEQGRQGLCSHGVPAASLTCCVTLGKLGSLSEPQPPHSEMSLTRQPTLWELTRVMCVVGDRCSINLGCHRHVLTCGAGTGAGSKCVQTRQAVRCFASSLLGEVREWRGRL